MILGNCSPWFHARRAFPCWRQCLFAVLSLSSRQNCCRCLVTIIPVLSLFGDDYTGAVPYLRMMLIAYAVQAACGPSVALLNMTGIHRAMTKIVSVWAGLTVIGLAVAMIQIGMLGGVVIAAVSVAGYPLILAILCRKTLGVDPTVLSLRYLVAR